MIDLWYYGRGSDISGPISGKSLSELAASGNLLETDTVWQEGNEDGVRANRIKHLFPAEPKAELPSRTMSLADDLNDVSLIELPELAVSKKVEAEKPAEAPPPPIVPKPEQKRNARATAGKGVTLMGQDGKTVRYRAKCGTCGREDASWKTVAIPRGTLRVSFFCPKCRKKRDGEMNGFQ